MLTQKAVSASCMTVSLKVQEGVGCKPWGDLNFQDEKSAICRLVAKICSRKHAEHWREDKGQEERVDRLIPACRWLAQRAPGMRSLHLTLSSTDSLDSSDSSEDMDARKSCTMRTLLPVLVGVLCGRALDIKLSISESDSPSFGLCEPDFMRKLSNHLIELHLDLSCCHEFLEMSAYEQICGLARLQVLDLCEPSLAGAQAVMASVSRLSALKHLEVREIDGEPLIISDEITCLQALTRVHLDSLADCTALAHLPAIKSLACSYAEDPFTLPSEQTCLVHLTELELCSVDLAGHVRGLPRLCNLRTVMFRRLQLADHVSPASLIRALGRLTNLVQLHLEDTHIGIQLTDLADLSKLEVLVIKGGTLAHAMCSCKWQRLHTLDLSRNHLTSLPAGLTSLVMLRTLILDCQIRPTDFQLGGLLDCFDVPHLSHVSLQDGAATWSAFSLCCMAKAKARAGAAGIKFLF